ncbi:hypothetical protein JF781_08765 [Mycobacterium sp. WUMAC-067]|uniref:hypothetical protein n=1 Tax=unclassified Mycobacterium TaxID=2642494 RepID=UPI001CDA53AB|nr:MULTISPECIES: hypothetical protein [unclassified Mycobacterium]MCA2242446.1 hypothetical protein [Mycobacterium sp. WUMAC-067]MCA2313831.1 hypothetical protein [Mycobacterium sp. WUMAC-025]
MSANTMTQTDRRNGLLRRAMRADALISGFFGVTGLTGWVTEFSGIPASFEYGLQVFFIVYGAIVLGLSWLPAVRSAGMAVVVANLLYAVGAVGGVLTGALPFTAAGAKFTLATAAYTLAFATLQYLGWRRSTEPITAEQMSGGFS